MMTLAPFAVPEYSAADFSHETWWLSLIKAVFIIVFLIANVLIALWVERRGLGRMQTRPGPNVAGPLGLFQAFADAGKLLFKEDMWTRRAERFLYFLAPAIAAFAAFSVFAVIPMGPNVRIAGISTPLQLTDMPVASLYILAMASVGLYGIVLGGWSTRSTLPLYGAVRSTAQVISYELAMGLSLVSVFLMSGSMSTSQIVAAQGQFWWGFTLLPAFVIYCISATGEVNRLPFDLPEAEGELVAGHMTEYSSMKFGWYYLSEYVNMLNVSAVATTMFFGGWHAPWPLSHVEFLNSGWWGMLWFFLKLWFFMFLLVWTRATLLRFRYDQFMNFGWKRLMPIALGWLVLVALVRGITQFVEVPTPYLFGGVGVLFLIALVIIWLLIAFRKLPLPPQEAAPAEGHGRFGRLWGNKLYRYGVGAQFFNVAAQTCTWTYTIIYAQDVVGTSPEAAGWWLQGSLLLFLVARFVMVFVLGIVRPALLLLIMAVFGVGCCLTSIFVLNIVGLIAVVCISAALSLMFPTIYGMALKGLGDDAKFGSAGLVMAILGGALIPMVQARVMDVAGSAVGFIVPAVCLALVAAYAAYDLLRTGKEAS